MPKYAYAAILSFNTVLYNFFGFKKINYEVVFARDIYKISSKKLKKKYSFKIAVVIFFIRKNPN